MTTLDSTQGSVKLEWGTNRSTKGGENSEMESICALTSNVSGYRRRASYSYFSV